MTSLKRVFDLVQSVCIKCGTPTHGEFTIGSKEYCGDDYQKEKEKTVDRRKLRLTEEAKKLLKDITEDL